LANANERRVIETVQLNEAGDGDPELVRDTVERVIALNDVAGGAGNHHRRRDRRDEAGSERRHQQPD
jgi:hypothetical protein